jgi:pimeloyl-ACP methyl ester carboxylesterase
MTSTAMAPAGQAGRNAAIVLPDGRTLEYWDGGDPNGRPTIYHPGTPVTRVLGRWGHEAAVAAGVRLIAINRPGYGGSSTVPGTPSLLGVGRDTAALADRLGLAEFAVFGASGGGPFAVATAIAAPAAVRAVGVVGGTGPWRLLSDESWGAEDRACLAVLDSGDASGARACFHRQVEEERAQLTPEAFYEAVVAGDPSAIVRDAGYRALWLENLRDVQRNPDGYVDDNIAWGGAWDVDPRDVVAPTLLWFGTVDTRCSHDGHGQWYAERIAGSELITLPGAAHFEVIDGRWPEVLEGLLRVWG